MGLDFHSIIKNAISETMKVREAWILNTINLNTEGEYESIEECIKANNITIAIDLVKRETNLYKGKMLIGVFSEMPTMAQDEYNILFKYKYWSRGEV